METTTVPRHGGNLRWSLLFAGALIGLWFVGLPLLEGLGPDDRHNRPLSAVAAVVVLLAPVALIWVVGEAHLRWSPPGRVARGVVGWTLALACLAVIVLLAPPALYLLVMYGGHAFGW